MLIETQVSALLPLQLESVGGKQTGKRWQLLFCPTLHRLPSCPWSLRTRDIWLSVIVLSLQVCLQAQCLLCCYYSFKLAGPVGCIDFVIVQITRERKWCWFDGTEWVEVGRWTSGAFCFKVQSCYIPPKRSLNVDVSRKESYMICTCLRVLACWDWGHRHRSRAAQPETGGSFSSQRKQHDCWLWSGWHSAELSVRAIHSFN